MKSWHVLSTQTAGVTGCGCRVRRGRTTVPALHSISDLGSTGPSWIKKGGGCPSGSSSGAPPARGNGAGEAGAKERQWSVAGGRRHGVKRRVPFRRLRPQAAQSARVWGRGAREWCPPTRAGPGPQRTAVATAWPH